VNAWNHRSIRSGNEAGSRTGELERSSPVPRAISSSRWARSRQGAARAVSVADSLQLNLPLVEPHRRPYHNPARGAEHGEQQRAGPSPELGGAAHHQTEAGRPGTALRAPTAARPGAGWPATPAGRSAGRPPFSDRGLSLPAPLVQPRTEDRPRHLSAGLGEWTPTTWLAVLAGGPQEDQLPTVHQQGEQKGSSSGGMRRAGQSPTILAQTAAVWGERASGCGPLKKTRRWRGLRMPRCLKPLCPILSSSAFCLQPALPSYDGRS